MTQDVARDEASRSHSPEDSADQDSGDMIEQADHHSKSDSAVPSSNGKAKSSSNAKDPLRPRRKKARRACFACQRAHLTCGKYFDTKVAIIPPYVQLLNAERAPGR